VKARCAGWAALALALCAAPAAAEPTTTFWYTGLEQAYVVPPGASEIHVRATGGAGGGGNGGGPALPPGRGAIVEGNVAVRPGQMLYVVVGNSGGLPDGGFNGGGNGATRHALLLWDGGGASDVRTVSSGQGAASLESRLIVAAGGGGSAYMAGAGGDAGNIGSFGPGGAADAAQPGTATAGGAGGPCGGGTAGCGEPGGLGFGGDGGASGEFADGSYGIGAGGGGGWYGGGGGRGYAGGFGSGAGGSSKSPRGGKVTLADRALPPRVSITPYLPQRTGCSDGADNDADGLVDHPADPGCAGRGDEDESNPDTFAPDARLSAPATQRLGRTVKVEVRCRATAEDCIVSATGKLSLGRAARAYRLRPARGVVVRRASKLMLRLRGRTRIHADLKVQVADESGNLRRLTRRIRLVR
jgi:hypothetical protein